MVEKIVDYLKIVSDLETSIFKQQKASQTAHDTLVYKLPKMPKSKISKPSINVKKPVKSNKLIIFKSLIVIFIVTTLILVVLGGLMAFKQGNDSGIGFAFFGLLYILPTVFLVNKCKEINNSYNERMTKYNDCVKEYENKKAKYDELLKKETEKNTIELKKNIEIYNKNYNDAKDVIEELDKNLEETQNSLALLYNKNVIFPKYRNLVAMTTIYEYFVSGRVSELEGPNGAYNLYENELRQNIIINNLETISSNLENIKNNQYVLYTELENLNNIMYNIQSDVNDILSNTKQITENSYITAYSSQITAQNTAALKMIEFLK